MKKVLALLAIVVIILFPKISKSQTVLYPGDMAFVGMNCTNDGFAFVTWVDLCPGTVVYFSDNPYRNSNGFCTSQEEFCVSLTVTVKIPKGTVITYSDGGPGTFSIPAGAGTIAWAFSSTAGTNNGFSNSNDNCFAFQGTYAAPKFICGIKTSAWNAAGTVTCSNRADTELPSMLTDGVNAIVKTNGGSACIGTKYNCSATSGTQAQLNAAVNNPSNWNCSGSSVSLPPACSFTITVPTCSGPPTTLATSLTFSNITTTAAKANWISCEDVIVVVHEGSAVNQDPASGTAYTANAAFGSGSQIGTGNYVVYEGSGSSVSVTGLNPCKTYYVAVYVYYPSGLCYNTAELAGNFNTLSSTLTETITPVNPACNGGSTGSASVSVTGGTANYTYVWSQGGSTNSSISGLNAGTYTCVVTDANGCTATKSTTLTNPATFTTTASNTGPYCPGSAIQLNAGAGAQYAWSGANNYNNATQTPNIPNSTTAMAGSYNVTVTDANGCTASATTTVVIQSSPSVTASNTGPYCAGATVQFNSSGGASYAWSGPNIYSNGSQNPSIANATTLLNGVYTVIVTDANSCTASATTSLLVNNKPIASAFNTGPYCIGANIQLNSSGGSSYSWSGANNFSDATQNPAIANSTSVMAGAYTVTITDANGCSATATTSVVINAAPSITASNTGPYCVGTNIQLNSSGGVQYSWSGPNNFSNGNQNPGITGATSANSGNYTVTVTDAGGCSASATTTVIINNAPPATASNNGPYCIGSNVQLNSSGGTSYSWSGPNSFSDATQNPGIANSTAAASGVYMVLVTDANSCTATATTTVLVNTTLNPIATNTGPYCTGDSIKISVAGGSIYSWSGPNNYSDASQNPVLLNGSVSMSGTYSVTANDANGCSGIASTNVIINTLPVVGAGNTGPYCVGSSILLNASGAANYVWSGPNNYSNASQNPTIAGSTAVMSGTYNVVATDANGCSASASTTVVVNTAPDANAGADQIINCASPQTNLNGSSTTNGVSYGWTGTGIVSGGNTATPLVNTSGTYTLLVTDANNCTASDIADVTSDFASPTANAGADVQLTCTVSSLLLTATSTTTGATFAWSNNANNASTSVTAANTYTVTVTNPANGCTATDQVIVSLNNTAPNANAGPDETLGCTSGTAQLSGSSTTTGVSYSWTGGGITSGSNTAIPQVNQAGTYTLVVTDNNNGCTASDATDISSSSPLAIDARVTNSPCAQVGGEIDLQVTGGIPPYAFRWSNSSANSTISALRGGQYSVTVNDAGGCSADSSYLITENILSVTAYGDTTIEAGNATPLTGIATGGNGQLTYLWQPGGSLSCNDCASPIATPGSSTLYTLQVTDAMGCTNSATVSVNVTIRHNLFVPNAFTPNSDGNNDLFSAFGNLDLIDIFSISIYDRWGEKVFESDNAHFGWDGTYKSAAQGPQVLVYYIKALFHDGYNAGLMGSLTLIR